MPVLAADAVVPAVIGLLGVLVTALIAFLGVRVNRRSERRLRLEAALNAAKVLTPAADSPPAPETSATALLSLADLEQLELAMILLNELWPCGRVSNESAILLVDKALQARERPAQRIAAEMLWYQSVRLDARASTDWPRCIDGRWPNDRRHGDDRRTAQLGPLSRLFLLDAMLKMTLTQKVDKDTLSALAVRIFAVCEAEDDPDLQRIATAILGILLPALEHLSLTRFLHADIYVPMSELRRAASVRPPVGAPSHDPVGVAMRERLDQVQQWVDSEAPIAVLMREIETTKQERRAAATEFDSPVTPGSSFSPSSVGNEGDGG
jgi:hypothetical protein